MVSPALLPEETQALASKQLNYARAKGCKTTILCRNATRAQDAIAKIKNSEGKTVHFVQLDLTNPKSIERCAEISTRDDILVNNAGVMLPPLTAEGYDETYQANCLGHHQFFSALERLRKASVLSRVSLT